MTMRSVLLCCLSALCMPVVSAIAQPANDLCMNASPLPVQGGAFLVDMTNATADTPDVSCALNRRTVWFSYTPTQSGLIDVSLCASRSEAALSFWTDCSTQVMCMAQNSGCPGDQPRGAYYNWPVTAGQTILIAVSVGAEDLRTTQLTLTPFLGPPPANDNCDNPQPIANGVHIVSNGTATNSQAAIPPCFLFGEPAGDLWYSYTATCTGQASAAMLPGSLPYGMVEVLDACGGTTLACADGIFAEPRVTWPVVQGQQYLVRFAGFADSGGFVPAYGTFSIQFACESPVPNDACAGAQPIELGLNTFDTRFASTSDYPVPPCSTEPDTNDVFFSFTPATNMYIQAALGYGTNPSESGWPVILTVYDACGGEVLACDDMDLNDLPEVWFAASSNHTYIMRVATHPSDPGTGTLRLIHVADPAPNDECAGAAKVEEGTTNFNATVYSSGAYTSADPLACFYEAIRGSNEPMWYDDLWYSYTPDFTGRISVVTTGHFVAEIYLGCDTNNAVACSNLTNLLPNGADASETCLYVNEGQQYTIRVGKHFFIGLTTGQLTIERRDPQPFSPPAGFIPEPEICVEGIRTNDACGADYDTLANVALVGVDTPVLGSYMYGNDEDYYAINLVAGQQYVFEGQSETAGLVRIGTRTVCNAQFQTLAINRLDGDCRQSFSLQVTPVVSGRHYVLVQAERPDVDCSGNYWFRVRPEVALARCNPADIAYDNGDFLPPIGISGGTNNGVTEADYNVFFANFFDAGEICDIANDDGTPLPPFGDLTTNNGTTEADYNLFFSIFFDGCSF